MFKNFTRLMIPLMVILGTAVLNKLVLTFLSGDIINIILRIVTILALFWLGILFNRGKSPNAIFRKIIAIVSAAFFLCMEMGWLYIPAVSDILVVLGIDGLFFSLLYIYCGYLYNDN